MILGKPHHPYCVLDGGVFLCAASSKQHSRCSGLPKGNPQVPQYCFSSSPKISGVALRFSGCPLFGAHIFINAAHSPFPNKPKVFGNRAPENRNGVRFLGRGGAECTCEHCPLQGDARGQPTAPTRVRFPKSAVFGRAIGLLKRVSLRVILSGAKRSNRRQKS